MEEYSFMEILGIVAILGVVSAVILSAANSNFARSHQPPQSANTASTTVDMWWCDDSVGTVEASTSEEAIAKCNSLIQHEVEVRDAKQAKLHKAWCATQDPSKMSFADYQDCNAQ